MGNRSQKLFREISFLPLNEMKSGTIFICGERGQGKTTFASELVYSLRQENFRIGGLLAPGYWKNNLRDRFVLQDIATGDELLFCQRENKAGWEKIRHFYINPAGQKFGEKALHPDSIRDCDIVVVDEIGPFELAGKGWHQPIVQLMDEPNLLKLFVVRNSLIKEICNHYSITHYSLVQVGNEKIEDVLTLIHDVAE